MMNTDNQKAACDISEFCQQHSISKAFLYMLWRRGDGPSYMLVGHKRLISAEAGAAWRRSTEALASELSAATTELQSAA
jgi:hypothetical protein